MANGSSKVPEKQSCSKFFYNKQMGTILGKTRKAWCKLILNLKI